jgi:hypothetical protein
VLTVRWRQEGWIFETREGQVMNAVGVDVGGTKIAAGVVSPEGELLKR